MDLTKLLDPRIFNYIILSLYGINMVWWGFGQKQWGQAWYWLSAASITASVTWGGWIK